MKHLPKLLFLPLVAGLLLAVYMARAADVSGSNTIPNTLILPPQSVAALPACNAGLQGVRATVTNNATATAYLGAVTTGGSTVQGVLCNGTSWVQD